MSLPPSRCVAPEARRETLRWLREGRSPVFPGALQRPDVVRRRFRIVVGPVAVVDAVHVGGELDPPAAGRVNEPEDIGADRVPAQPPGLMPAAVDHVVGADDHLVDVGHLVRRVVDARPVRAMAQQQRVLIGVARAAHEHAHVADPVGGHEAEQVGVERGRPLPPRLLDVDRDVAQPQRPDPPRRLERPVPPGHGPGPVGARVRCRWPPAYSPRARRRSRSRQRCAPRRRPPGFPGRRPALPPARRAPRRCPHPTRPHAGSTLPRPPEEARVRRPP